MYTKDRNSAGTDEKVTNFKDRESPYTGSHSFGHNSPGD